MVTGGGEKTRGAMSSKDDLQFLTTDMDDSYNEATTASDMLTSE